MKFLITGITGSAASYLAEYLLKLPNIELFGTTRSYNNSNQKNLFKIKDKTKIDIVDFTDFSSVYRYLSKIKPDYIFHLASSANVKSSFDSPIQVVNNNVNITLVLLEAIRFLKESSGYDPIILICSTAEVYGNPDKKYIPITEECPLNPINPYAVSKLTQDSLAYVYFLAHKLKIIRTRMFSYFNARRSDLFATNFAIQILEIKNKKRKILEHGNLQSIRTMININNASEAYYLAITKGKFGEVYNIGGIIPLSVGDILQKLIEHSGLNIEAKCSQSLIRPSDSSFQIPDISKFRIATGWTPEEDMDKNIQSFYKEIEENISI